MAENRTMTTVGTRGYTAPEVLRGEHYGTGADVFSFGVVMNELLSLSPPYEMMLKDKDGNTLMTWEQIVELSKSSGLRPRIPDFISPDMASLIRQCFAEEAAERPSFSVILFSLKSIFQDEVEKRGITRVSLGAGSSASNLSGGGSKRKALKAGEDLGRTVHGLLWNFRRKDWSKKQASALIERGATVTAKDDTLRAILEGEKGPSALQVGFGRSES